MEHTSHPSADLEPELRALPELQNTPSRLSLEPGTFVIWR
jgi:hypothetical protein